MSAVADTFKRNKALFLFLIGLVIVCAVIYAIREPLIPFVLGFIFAYLTLPLVDWVDRKLPFNYRGHATQRIIIILVFLIVLQALVYLIAFFVLSSLINSFSVLLANAPALITGALDTIGEWTESLLSNLAPPQQKQAQDIIDNLGTATGDWLQESFLAALKFIPSSFTFMVGFFILPLFLILFMANVRAIGKGFYGLFSTEVLYHVRNFARILDNVFGRFIKAQLLLAVAIGALVYIALLIIGIDLSAALAVVAAVLQLIPAIGGLLAAIIGSVVVLAIAPAKIVWVVIAYLVINLVFGTVLIAKFEGSAVDLDASVVMVLIVIGGYLGGIIGMILLPPFAAILFDLYKYVRDELRRSQLDKVEQ